MKLFPQINSSAQHLKSSIIFLASKKEKRKMQKAMAIFLYRTELGTDQSETISL